MFFILSKTLNYLTMPLTFVIICLLASWIIREAKWKKRFFVAGVVLLLFFSNEFIANEVMRAWEVSATPFSETKHHRLAVVLTGATTDKIDPNDRVYFQRGADRVYHTVQLYKLGLIDSILVSGGSGSLVWESEPEANKFREAMQWMGVPDSVIAIENDSRNTYESAIAVKKILEKEHFKNQDLVLVTSAFHMRRSIACFGKVGLHPAPFATDFYSHRREFYFDTLFIPQLEAIALWHKVMKEWVGMLAYWITGHI